MKTSNIIIVALMTGMLLASVNIIYAQWSALASGYAVTTNYHGVDVPPGTLITAIAGTTDGNVKSVTFLWKDPDGSVAFEETKSIYTNGTTYNGKLIRYANSSYIPDTLGDWCVQALFIGTRGTTKANTEEVIRIRATSFNMVPDFPAVGVAGALSVMMLSLYYFYVRKKAIKLK
ncbi:MAG: hypothetical protein QXY73_04025 [Candidatus Bathyarchaeia archaeon]